MIVLKFGGTSVGSADRMNEVIDILEKSEQRQLVVLSAMSGTTNDLVAISDALNQGSSNQAGFLIHELNEKYNRVLTDLYASKSDRDEARQLIQPSFDLLQEKLAQQEFNLEAEREILAQGELISTALFSLQCRIRGLNVTLLPALSFMRTDENGEPDLPETAQLLEPYLSGLDDDVDLFITQGYICRNHKGRIDNLQRGGSDYTATILGAILNVAEVQIWTDIDGVHNNDPRVVNDTKPIRRLSYREAAELAYFGAKILHPTCVLPAERRNVPLRLKCTMNPEAEGTLISEQTSNRSITALAAKDGITAIKIYSHRMLNAYGFLKKLFAVFEHHRTPVDMITTSEVAVSLTIDDVKNLDHIIAELEEFAEVEVEHNFSIVCIVGNALYDDSEHVNRIFEALRNIPIRMVSMGGSRYNMSILVNSNHRVDALIALNSLFQDHSINELSTLK